MAANGTKKDSHLEGCLEASLQKRERNSTLRKLTTYPSRMVDFSSNDFLGLATSPALRQAFLHELKADPKFSIGSGGSRLLDGNSMYAEALEREIAAFHNAEAGLLCNSGFDANVGLFSCLPQRGDVIVYDELIHASVHDGMKHSRAGSMVPFTHNSVEAFRRVLKECLAADERLVRGKKSVFVAVEAIYSMDGDIAPLKEIIDVLDQVLPKGNGHVIVDEAHSTGVLGLMGRGLVCDSGLEGRVLARLHTFGKALACNGAIILCSPLIRQYLVNYARPLIYTTFMCFPGLAAIKAGYSLLKSGHTTSLQQHLFSLIRHMHTLLRDVERRTTSASLLRVQNTCPESAIFSVQSSEPRLLAAWCQRDKYLVRAIVPPTVPKGQERIRVCLHAGNTMAEVEGLVARIEEWIVVQTRSKL